MELADDHTLCAIDDECSLGSHVGYGSQEDVLNDGIKVLMIRVGA